ncbi:DUF6444 domain-containing protein [Cohnella fermenti]|uniref:DUF6444 domain-containing protein n=1 Tax=Cohnella fermenti TaxID=2565925 RepID=UPI001454DB1C
MEMTPEQVMKICKGDEEIAVFFHALLANITTLEKRIQELERRLGQNSSNSNKPPSSALAEHERASG